MSDSNLGPLTWILMIMLIACEGQNVVGKEALIYVFGTSLHQPIIKQPAHRFGQLLCKSLAQGLQESSFKTLKGRVLCMQTFIVNGML